MLTSQEINVFEPKKPFKIREKVKRIIEALLFSSSQPISISKILAVINTEYSLTPSTIRDLIAELNHIYDERQSSFSIEEIGGGFLMQTRKEYYQFVSLLHRERKAEKLSVAATEALAIIAYRQPVTKVEVEAIRGVDSSGVVQALLERELIQSMGNADSPGKPILYGTTQKFLNHFGLHSLRDLARKFSSN